MKEIEYFDPGIQFAVSLRSETVTCLAIRLTSRKLLLAIL
jgi:hypothetical protein